MRSLPSQLPDPSEVPWVAVDTETSGLHPDDGARVACVSLSWPALGAATGGYATAAFPFDQGVRDKLPTAQMEFGVDEEADNLPREEWDALMGFLSSSSLVFHNAKFDLAMLRVGTRHWEGVDFVHRLEWDTMLAQGILDPLHPRGLDATAKRLGLGAKVGVSELQGWLKRRGFDKHRYDLAPWHLVAPYVAADTEMTAELYDHQLSRVDGRDQDRMMRELALTRALYGMESRGICYDDAVSLEAAEELERVALGIEVQMPFACTPTEAHRYFFGELGLEPMRVSEKTGRPSLDEEQVRQWVKDGVEWASEYAQVTKYRRSVSMHYRGYPEKIGRDGRLRCTYRQGHVKSGRMSVERVQLQALPKRDKNIEGIPGVRELVHPAEGHRLWNLDLSQAELRVASQYAQCRRMLEQLAEGQDIHSNTNRQVLGIDDDDPLWKEKRDIAKRLTFGGIFQIGGEKFQATLAKLADIHLPLQECKNMVAAWRQMYPEFGVAYRRSEQEVRADGYVRLLPNTDFETRSYFGERDFPNSGWNRIVQGSLAEGFKILLGDVEQNWPGRAILTVHDSILLETPADDGDRVAFEVAAHGERLMTSLYGIDMSVDINEWGH